MAPALMLVCAPSFPTASQVLVAWCGLHRLRTPAPNTVPSPQLALVSADSYMHLCQCQLTAQMLKDPKPPVEATELDGGRASWLLVCAAQ